MKGDNRTNMVFMKRLHGAVIVALKRNVTFNLTTVCVCGVCVCDEYGVQAIYITMQGVLLHMYVLCEYSVRNKSPKSLQVVQAQSCVCVHTDVYIHAHVSFVITV